MELTNLSTFSSINLFFAEQVQNRRKILVKIVSSFLFCDTPYVHKAGKEFCTNKYVCRRSCNSLFQIINGTLDPMA